ncbi:CASC3/Barentsz eIF4AIII binding protein [Dictyocaulus viviparus]|uniref:Protein CASC3 n=1 Tax=Dictyocaulus viviparus TaxID=29172 RepID=A0A0D8XLE1_DICVI|nr:CASC3/Barentsz eIF4AIII binding protein [Dictyocaulus viviparus]
MSEMVESTPPLISEDDKKFEDADIAEKMKNVKIQEIPESSPPLHETDGAENDNMVRENGEEGFHTPEVTSENQNDSNFVNDDAKLDYDEIEDNPAYIPRKGKYYMHDSRDADEVEEKKTSRADGAWKHDRYNERFQRPKTKKQIMTRYGFDIREENTQDVGLSQKKRTQEVNKEEYGEEITKGKRPTKKDTRRKQPSREKAYDVTPKLRHQNSHKLVGQRSERKVSESRNKGENIFISSFYLALI